MTVSLTRGRLTARFGADAADLAAAQALRHACFIIGAGLPARDGGLDRDRFDPVCRHVLIAGDAGLVATCRLMALPSGAGIGGTYAAQFYDLGRLAGFSAPVMEVGRFCIAPGTDPGDALRLVWGFLTAIVDAEGVGLLIGCSSFPGLDPAPYADALALLGAAHQAPDALKPVRRAPETLPLPSIPPADRLSGLSQMPPLLRSYLGMGGWVSDHAVVDRDLNTLHVFTGVEVARVPAHRARALRLLAG